MPIQFNSVGQLCLTPCDSMNLSTPGLPVHHQLLEFTQTHVHRVGDAIQPSHPLSPPSPPAHNSFLACRTSAERSAVKCIGFPLYLTCCFSLAAFSILSLCLVFVSLISMCLGMLEKTLESPLDCKEIQPVHPKGDQSWVFIGRTDAEAETPILWPPHAKS